MQSISLSLVSYPYLSYKSPPLLSPPAPMSRCPPLPAPHSPRLYHSLPPPSSFAPFLRCYSLCSPTACYVSLITLPSIYGDQNAGWGAWHCSGQMGRGREKTKWWGWGDLGGCCSVIKHRFGMTMKTAKRRQTRGLWVRQPQAFCWALQISRRGEETDAEQGRDGGRENQGG